MTKMIAKKRPIFPPRLLATIIVGPSMARVNGLTTDFSPSHALSPENL